MAKSLVIVSSALLSHLFNWCIVGACDAVLLYLNANVGSTAFTVGTSLMLSEYARFPSFLQEPSKIILYAYYIFLAFFVSSLSTRLVWMPLTDSFAELNIRLAKAMLFANRSMKLDRKSLLRRFASFLETKSALAWTSDIFGVLFLYWVCDSLKVSTNVKNFFESAPGFKKMFGTELCKTWSGILQSRALRRKNVEKCNLADVVKSDTSIKESRRGRSPCC